MKNLPVFLISLFFLSCTAIAPFNVTPVSTKPLSTITAMPSTATLTPTLTQLAGTHTLELTTTEENIDYRQFTDEWIYVHQIKSACIDFDSENQIWSFSWKSNPLSFYLEYFDGSTWNKVPTPDGFGLDWSCPYVRKDGTIVFIPPRYNIPETMFYLDVGSKSWTTVEIPEFLTPQEKGRRVVETIDALGRIWIGLDRCPNDASCLYRLDDNQWKEEPLPFPSIRSISADQNGGVWVGGNEESGIAHYDGNDWIIYDIKSLWTEGQESSPPKPINVITSPDGSVWVIRHYEYDWIRIETNGEVEHYPSKVMVDESNILTVFADNHERLWFFWNYDQIGYFDYRKNQWVYFTGLPNGTGMGNPSFISSPNGDLWFVLANNIKGKVGIYKYSPSEE